MYYEELNSPLGDILLMADNTGITHLSFQQGLQPYTVPNNYQHTAHLFTNIREQLTRYFAGEPTTFDVPLSWQGTSFQQSVWQALTTIAYGETWSYKQLALAIANPKAVRAVGTANGANKIAVIVPCHRVIGSNNTLTGYAGGTELKAKLLKLEGASFKC